MEQKITIVTVNSESYPGLSGILTPAILKKISDRTGLNKQEVLAEIDKLVKKEILSLTEHELH